MSRVSRIVLEHMSAERITDVPNFRVTHKTIIQADIQAMGCNITNMAFAPELVHVLGLAR